MELLNVCTLCRKRIILNKDHYKTPHSVREDEILSLFAVVVWNSIHYVLSEKFNQDPLEEHFGKQCMRGGGVENPSLEQYTYNEHKIIVSKSDVVTSMRGNTQGWKREGRKRE